MYMTKSTAHGNGGSGMNGLNKEMRMHTLRGDLQEMGMAQFSKAAMRRQLKHRYVTEDGGITDAEFEAILSEEHAKARAWHIERLNNGEAGK
jgi:hypothetical protein